MMHLFLTMMAYYYSPYDEVNEKCYNACADQWDRFPFPQFLPTLFFQYFDPSAGNTVLDIGSGTGKVAEWLACEGFNVTCLDSSAEMVRRCQDKGLKTFHSTIQAYATEETFSAIVAILSFIHVPKKEFVQQIEKMDKMLNANGLFVLSLLEGSTEGIGESSSRYPRFFALYEKEEVLSLLKEYFVLLDYREVKSGHTYMTFFLRKKE